MLRALSIDPLNVASNAATEVALITADITDSIAPDAAVSTAESVLSQVQSALYTYTNEAAHRLTYCNAKKKAYENQYGPVDPNAPSTLAEPNFCVRGDACTMKSSSNPANPEEHQRSCPHKIDGLFFGIGERDCPGRSYICDRSYVCDKRDDHKMDWFCPHERIRVGDYDKHKMLMPGPCHPSHDYYACNETHELVDTGRCREKKSARVWNSYGDYYEHVNVKCTNRSSYYKCTPHTHSYPTHNSAGYAYYYY